MDFLLYLAFSVLETYALFFMAFKLFKIDLYPKEMLFSSLIMGFFSYVLRNDYGLIQVDLFLQFILIFCFMWMLFKIHFFYAAIMTGITYQAYSLIQTLYYFLLNKTTLFSIDFNFVAQFPVYLLQTLSATTAIIIGTYISKKRKGFDFVPDKPTGRINITTREKVLFSLNLPSILIVLSTMYFSEHLMQYYFIIPLSYALVLYSFLYLSYKKDR
ncbi:MAG: hypothetical protein K6T94_25975, partial [Paenibacillus sp.]|nr:hypothetical protein [Paenibacillus sp.]